MPTSAACRSARAPVALVTSCFTPRKRGAAVPAQLLASSRERSFRSTGRSKTASVLTKSGVASLTSLSTCGRRGGSSGTLARVMCRASSAIDEDVASCTVIFCDHLVIGSGIAGLSYALRVADVGKVAIVTKDVAHEGSTRYAQGGICAVLDANDSVESHIHDTMVAGDYLCDPKAVEMVCSEGADAVLELVEMGAEFTTDSTGNLHLAREGGHEHHRIVHAADMTGREIERVLVEKARAHPNISFFEHHFATDLVTTQEKGTTRCIGVDVVDRKSAKDVRFLSTTTMLASGGAGHIYPNTTNPTVATGDGIAIAARGKATVANMEFMQFHPTSLYVDDDAKSPQQGSVFLITEAVRGDGGLLYNAAGERFMPGYDKRAELAPRDVVARSIDDQLKKHGDKCVYLDITHKPAEEILEHFPNIAVHLKDNLGLDITKDRIPVVPAMHYTCGGVKTDLNGETTLLGLFATGEAAYTGLHGANRLASNSLLEGLVYGFKAAKAANRYLMENSVNVKDAMPRAVEAFCRRDPAPSTDQESVEHAMSVLRNLRRKLQTTMWENAGIVRSNTRLLDAMKQIQRLREEMIALSEEMFLDAMAAGNPELTVERYELYNLLTVSELVVQSAMSRKESRGLHYTTDYPYKVKNECHPTILEGASNRKQDRKQIRRVVALELASSDVESMSESK